jgi:3-phosphoinositide dependent protein kinase-1
MVGLIVALCSPDLWALGCTLHFLLFASYPFSAATEYLTMERVKKLDYSTPEGCDPVAHDLIKRLLVRLSLFKSDSAMLRGF